MEDLKVLELWPLGNCLYYGRHVYQHALVFHLARAKKDDVQLVLFRDRWWSYIASVLRSENQSYQCLLSNASWAVRVDWAFTDRDMERLVIQTNLILIPVSWTHLVNLWMELWIAKSTPPCITELKSFNDTVIRQHWGIHVSTEWWRQIVSWNVKCSRNPRERPPKICQV